MALVLLSEKKSINMSKIQRNKINPFYLDNGRAMVSLGPLNTKRHCSFSCAFCYVQDEFVSYANLSVDEIINFLKSNRQNYKIIYVSGDTDSFAPPRTDKALDLLYIIATEIQCDLLFTTRTTFSEAHYHKLKQIVNEQKKANKMLYACVSITRLSADSAYLEPYPIPSPQERMIVLKRMKEIGATTVLAMRPFLPVIDIDDYLTIIDETKQFVDIVLGEDFYFIRGGNLAKRVFPNGILNKYEKDIIQNQRMPFDDNDANWNIWKANEYQQTIQNKCNELGVVFSMHSENAIVEFQARNKK
jgi:DNA repair photolyase